MLRTTLLAALVGAAATGSAIEIQVHVDGRPVAFPGAPPTVVAGRLLVPLRGVLEAMGASVEFSASSKTVLVRRSSRRIEMKVGSNRALVDGGSHTLDAPPIIKAGTVLIPLRFVSEALGARVRWDVPAQTVFIDQAEDVATAWPFDKKARPLARSAQ